MPFIRTDLIKFQYYSKEKVLAKVKEKITELKQKVKPKQTKLVLSDSDVKKQPDELHRKFVIVSVDKASNNS